MSIDFNNTGSRSEKRSKRRKTNIILNTLIAIVIILIIIVGKNIFFGAPKPQQSDVQETPIKDVNHEQKQQEQATNGNSQEQTKDENQPSTEEETDNSGSIENESSEPNVEKVIVNPDWKPIGTEQTNGHQSSYDMSSVDWKEKEKAAAYAINTQIDNMTTWWLRRGEDPVNQSILTVSAKGSSDTYEVYVEWVEGQGWKPTEVKKLIKNDRR
ncbi:YrrS family protein [Bacillus sp. FJAT-49732]|uniref:YrrS family protein n=1 Tax=Lederbergia citrisecunda TaxID=2833583 RepID=A0A942TM21_9BACI|nr:YrrS family protein [Lederbergia citrisecunda]